LLGEITPLQAERMRQLLTLVPTDGSVTYVAPEQD